MRKTLLVLSLSLLWLPSGVLGQINIVQPGQEAPLAGAVQGITGGVPIAVTGGGTAGGSTEAKQDDQITELQSILAKILAAPSTEAKQDDLNALIVIIDAVLDAIKTDTVNISADQSTETTSAAILAKIIAAPATEAKQDDLNALIVIIDAVLDAIKSDTSNISADQATQTTLAAVLAKLIAAPATEAKQDTGNTSLATIAGVDFSTQTTLAAVLAKIIAAPATEAKQDTGNTSLATIAGLDFSTQTTLAAVLAKIIAAPATEAKQDTGNTSLGSIVTNTGRTPAGAPVQGNKSVVVGVGPTEILALDLGRRFAIVCNADNTLVAVGKTGLTLNSAVATDGKVLNPSGTPGADDGTGGCLAFETTPAIFGKGTDTGSKVTVFWGTI